MQDALPAAPSDAFGKAVSCLMEAFCGKQYIKTAVALGRRHETATGPDGRLFRLEWMPQILRDQPAEDMISFLV